MLIPLSRSSALSGGWLLPPVLVRPLQEARESLRANLDLYVGHHTLNGKYKLWGEERDAPHRAVNQMIGQHKTF